MNGRTYDARRFSPLDQTNAGNVAKLVPRWIDQTGKPATFQATPLVADGVLHLGEPTGSVAALDAVASAKLWHCEHKVKPGTKLCCGPANHGVGLDSCMSSPRQAAGGTARPTTDRVPRPAATAQLPVHRGPRWAMRAAPAMV